MQRLPVNSLNFELLQELSTIFDALEKDNSRGMILTSVSGHPCNSLIDGWSGCDGMWHLILKLEQQQQHQQQL
jgi:hypothetical protein